MLWIPRKRIPSHIIADDTKNDVLRDGDSTMVQFGPTEAFGSINYLVKDDSFIDED